MRTSTIIKTDKTDEEIKTFLGELLISKGYVFTTYKKMEVWKKGNGWLTAPQIFKIDKIGNELIIESWIPFALLPGVFLGESGLNSGFGFAVKVAMRKVLKSLIEVTIAPETMPSGYIPK